MLEFLLKILLLAREKIIRKVPSFLVILISPFSSTIFFLVD